MAQKKERKLKVYGTVGKWYKDPPKILLRGKWLEQCGFDCGDQIKVKCENKKLTISLMEQEATI